MVDDSENQKKYFDRFDKMSKRSQNVIKSWFYELALDYPSQIDQFIFNDDINEESISKRPNCGRRSTQEILSVINEIREFHSPNIKDNIHTINSNHLFNQTNFTDYYLNVLNLPYEEKRIIANSFFKLLVELHQKFVDRYWFLFCDEETIIDNFLSKHNIVYSLAKGYSDIKPELYKSILNCLDYSIHQYYPNKASALVPKTQNLFATIIANATLVLNPLISDKIKSKDLHFSNLKYMKVDDFIQWCGVGKCSESSSSYATIIALNDKISHLDTYALILLRAECFAQYISTKYNYIKQRYGNIGANLPHNNDEILAAIIAKKHWLIKMSFSQIGDELELTSEKTRQILLKSYYPIHNLFIELKKLTKSLWYKFENSIIIENKESGNKLVFSGDYLPSLFESTNLYSDQLIDILMEKCINAKVMDEKHLWKIIEMNLSENIIASRELQVIINALRNDNLFLDRVRNILTSNFLNSLAATINESNTALNFEMIINRLPSYLTNEKVKLGLSILVRKKEIGTVGKRGYYCSKKLMHLYGDFDYASFAIKILKVNNRAYMSVFDICNQYYITTGIPTSVRSMLHSLKLTNDNSLHELVILPFNHFGLKEVCNEMGLVNSNINVNSIVAKIRSYNNLPEIDSVDYRNLVIDISRSMSIRKEFIEMAISNRKLVIDLLG